MSTPCRCPAETSQNQQRRILGRLDESRGSDGILLESGVQQGRYLPGPNEGGHFDGVQELVRHCQDMLAKYEEYIRDHLEHLPEIRDWVWTPPQN